MTSHSVRSLRLLAVCALISMAFSQSVTRAADQKRDAIRLLTQFEKTGTAIWDVSNQLVTLANMPEAKIHVIKVVDEYMTHDKPAVKLLCARTILQLNDAPVKNDTREFSAAETLLELAANGDVSENIRLAAAELIGMYRALSGNAGFERRLRNVMTSCTNDNVKISLCSANWRLYQNRRNSGMILAGIMRRPVGRETKIEAAVALFEMGIITGDSKPLLSDALSEPTANGSRARLLVELRNMERISQVSEIPPDKNGYTIQDGEATLREILNIIYKLYPDQDKLSLEKFYENSAIGMMSQLDRFSTYMTRQDVKDLDQSMSGNYYGIGAYVGMESKRFTIIAPIYGSPADKAGLRSGDWITEVDGERTVDLRMGEIIKRLKGPKGTPVNIKYFRRGFDEEKPLTIIRNEIKIPSVLDQRIPGDIGYIRLTTFGMNSADDIRKAITNFEKSGVKGLILDLRQNGGGLLQGAVDICDLFLPKGKLIVYDMGLPTVKPRENFYSTAPHTNLPLVILVDGGSASASEIVSGCMRDHKRATLVGEKTYGKGTVQKLIPLQTTKKPQDKTDDHAARLKLTVAKYYLPNGDCIHEKGVQPDVVQPADRYKSWQIDEIIQLNKTNKISEYVADHFEKNVPLFTQLAMYDGGDTSQYPDFDPFYNSLNTKLSKDTVRSLIRSAIRRKVEDNIHKRLVADVEEDTVLRRGILVLSPKIGLDVTTIKEYAGIPAQFAKQIADAKAAKEDAEKSTPENAKTPDDAQSAKNTAAPKPDTKPDAETTPPADTKQDGAKPEQIDKP